MALYQLKLQLTHLLQTAGDLIAGLEPYLLVFGFALDHALWSAGENDVAGLERNVARDVADHLPAVKDEVVRVRRLPGLAVHPAFQMQVFRLDLLSGNQLRAHR